MTAITLTINGERTPLEVEPRTHLGDAIREQVRLTGTHLGCEHGVCGACTVLLDGVPVRSCITFAVACDGQEVRSIEGFEEDVAMAQLRDAFTKEHGLQCGFCTPGMLIASRDIVLRIPDADEERIRHELSGNLCRCTGYVGIVKAVRSVIVTRQAMSRTAPVAAKPTVEAKPFAAFTPAAPVATQSVTAAVSDTARQGWTRFEENFVIRRTPAEVWEVLKDFPTIAAALPGAELIEHDDAHVKGRMKVKLGPIAASFAGSAQVERDDKALIGMVRGAGSDSGSGSRTKAEARYQVTPHGDGEAKVTLTVEYNLQGPLAQFSRSGLAQDLGRRIVGEFAANLNARLGGGPAVAAAVALDAGNMVGAVLWMRIKGIFTALFGNKT